jgi:hypothetical protein
MYLWELVGCDATEVSPRSGIGGDLGRVMRTVEAELVKFPGFGGRVSEVVPRISVSSLDTVHVPTGREWIARQDEDAGAYWEARYRSADPEEGYHLAPLHKASAIG